MSRPLTYHKDMPLSAPVPMILVMSCAASAPAAQIRKTGLREVALIPTESRVASMVEHTPQTNVQDRLTHSVE